MANYAGETLVISNTATQDGVAVTDDDVEGVSIIIYDSEGEIVVAETTMTWDAVQERWEYVWDTDGLDPATYRARCIMDGVGATLNWEYKRVRLARNPVTI